MNLGSENVLQKHVLKWEKVDLAIKPRGKLAWKIIDTIYSSERRQGLENKQVLIQGKVLKVLCFENRRILLLGLPF